METFTGHRRKGLRRLRGSISLTLLLFAAMLCSRPQPAYAADASPNQFVPEAQLTAIKSAIEIAGFTNLRSTTTYPPTILGGDELNHLPSQRGATQMAVRALLFESVQAANARYDTDSQAMLAESSTSHLRGFATEPGKGAPFNAGDRGVIRVYYLSHLSNAWPVGGGDAMFQCRNVIVQMVVTIASSHSRAELQQGETIPSMKQERVKVEIEKLAEAGSRQVKDLCRKLAQALAAGGVCTAQPPSNVANYDIEASVNARQGEGSANSPLDFAPDNPFSVRVTIYKKTGPNSKEEPDEEFQVDLYLDDALIAKGRTNRGRYNSENLQLSDTTPQGRSTHHLKIAAATDSGQQFGRVQDLVVKRGLQSIVVKAASSSGRYLLGDTVTITGSVLTHDDYALFLVPVQASIKIEQGGNLGGDETLATTTTDNTGFFTVTVPASAGKALPGLDTPKSAAWIVRAIPNDQNRYEDGSATVEVELESRGKLQATAATNKTIYTPAETVTVSGMIASEGKPVSASVAVSLNNSFLTTVQAGGDGHYEYAFSVADQARARRQFVTEGHYVVAVHPQAQGYDDANSGASVFFVVQEDDTGCKYQELEVTGVSGSPRLTHAFQPRSTAGGEPFPNPALHTGGTLTQGYILTTKPSDQVTLRLPFEGGAEAQIVVAGGTSIKIGKYCQGLDGRVTLRVYVSNPGSLTVSTTNPGSAPLDYAFVTPTAQISSLKTRYSINVDKQGATTITAQEDRVLVTPTNTALQPVTVPAGQQVQVTPTSVNGPTAASAPPGTGTGRTITIDVPANRAWTPTGVLLGPGDQVMIQASGTIEAARPGDTRIFYHQVPPAGRPQFHPEKPQPLLPALGLIGRIGGGHVVPVGPFARWSAGPPYGAGELFLGINDDTLEDNSGAWTVRITVFRSGAQSLSQPEQRRVHP